MSNWSEPDQFTVQKPAEGSTDQELIDSLFDQREMYRTPLRGDIETLRDRTGMTAAEGEAWLGSASGFFADAGITPSEVPALHALMVAYAGKPVDPATQQGWATESRRLLRETYGNDADARLAKAKEFLNAHPAVVKRLAGTGLGDHPRIVLALAERARHLRIR